MKPSSASVGTRITGGGQTRSYETSASSAQRYRSTMNTLLLVITRAPVFSLVGVQVCLLVNAITLEPFEIS